MIKKMIFVIGAAACTSLSIIFGPGFAHEIAAGVMPSTKLQSVVEGNISLPDPACAHAPWPFGCDWGTPTGRKKIVKKGEIHHHRYAHTAMRQGHLLLGSKL
jgi:hypothetical protein